MGALEDESFIKGVFSSCRKVNEDKEQEQPLADATSGE